MQELIDAGLFRLVPGIGGSVGSGISGPNAVLWFRGPFRGPSAPPSSMQMKRRRVQLAVTIGRTLCEGSI